MAIIYPSFFDSTAAKLPYVYGEPKEQKARRIDYRSPYLGITRTLEYTPRAEYGRAFDNVKGIQVAENLIILREVFINDLLPGDAREILRQFPGRLPNQQEIELIYANRSSLCNNLLELGESPLADSWYLFHKGGGRDNDFNYYCLDFATGDVISADCDECVAALLVD